jgi:hypothetical protein
MPNSVDYFDLTDGRRIFVITNDDGTRAYCADHDGEQVVVWRTNVFDSPVLMACLLHESLQPQESEQQDEDESLEEQAEKIIEEARQSISNAAQPVEPGYWLQGLSYHDAIQVLIDMEYQIIGESQEFTGDKQARLTLGEDGNVASAEFSSH